MYKAFLGFTIGAFLAFWAFWVGTFAASSAVRANFQKAAQERGYSEYCQSDGSWSWKGECDKK